jgi:hypothetical protein
MYSIYVVTYGGVVEPGQMAVARHWHSKHISIVNTPAAIEELQAAMFSVGSEQRISNKGQWDKL